MDSTVMPNYCRATIVALVAVPRVGVSKVLLYRQRCMVPMKLRYKLWLEVNNTKVFGDGPYELLRLTRELGSLRKAAQQMDMSYSKAWHLLRVIEKRLGFPLLERRAGGISGGGSSITPEAIRLMENYELFRQEAEKLLKEAFSRYFPSGSE